MKLKEEQIFIEKYNSEAYEKPSVAVDLLVFTIEEAELKVLLIRRNEFPFKNCLALPGVFVKIDESVDAAARRALYEETRLNDIYLEQVFTFGEVNRDPRMRVISVAYMALVPSGEWKPEAGARVSDVGWFSVKGLREEEIGFDHIEMIRLAVERIRNKVEYTTLVFRMMPKKFTLPELQKAYEIVLEKSLFKTNFRKKIMPFVKENGEMSSGNRNRPSKYYEFYEDRGGK